MPTSKIFITFPDGTKKEYAAGTTALDAAKSISEGLARAVLVGKVNTKLVDLSFEIKQDCTLTLLKYNEKQQDKEAQDVFRHSTAHLMAAAIKRLFPNAKFGVGPVVEEGFYYDIDVKLHETDIEKIEAEMKKLADEKHPFVRKEYSKKEALKMFLHDELKSELIKEKGGKGASGNQTDDESSRVSVYEVDGFQDFCLGPHVPNTSFIKAFKITKLAGAYWKGDVNNVQLTRIYGISFPDKKMLDAHLKLLEEAASRDHRKIGKELDLFSFHEESPGAVFYHPKGTIIFNELQKFVREEYIKRGFSEVVTPLVYDKSLWLTSGHWEHYKEHMFVFNVEGKEGSLKPMNCPSHWLI